MSRRATERGTIRLSVAFLLFCGAAVGAMSSASTGRAAVRDPQECSDCHDGQADPARPLAPHELLTDSTHADEDCDSCHESIDMEDLDLDAENPHVDPVAPVDCGSCHEDEAELYWKHGRLEVGDDLDLPACWDCHGSHDVRPSSDRRARTHPANLPQTCRSCHTRIDLIEKHENLRDRPILLYQSSVHAQPGDNGRAAAATCEDCHAAEDSAGERTAHRILSPADPDSTTFHFAIPATCGRCHEVAAADYADGIHGQLAARGDLDSPVCTDCHGEHGIVSPSDPSSPVSAGRVAETTCAPCHETEVLNERYGIPVGSLRSYVDTYHGLKRKSGDVRVANCSSCHGVHRILPHTDPTSSIHAENLKETCGECHVGISEELSRVPIHGDARGAKGWPHFFRSVYLWLIALTIGAMLLHNLGDWLRQLRALREQPSVARLTRNETLQHWLLAVSFSALAISGFSLRFSEAGWVQLLFGWGNGEGFIIRGAVHRASAILFVLCGIWHGLFLLTGRGRGMLAAMLPRRADLGELKQNTLYFLGLRDSGPRFARYSYIEKVEYFALLWGGLVMTFTGLMLWLDNWLISEWSVSGVLLEVAAVIHYYEAWLAALAIVVWHGYAVIFNPSAYPMNPAWIDGRMPRRMYAHEHPEGPNLEQDEGGSDAGGFRE